jgi:hypothetical protein
MNDVASLATLIDSQGFKFTVYLFNGQDKPTPLNKAVVKSLVLEESTTNIFIKGFIVIEDKYNILQRPWTGDIEAPEGMHYKFRNDGNDILLVNIQPVVEGQPTDALDPEVWNLALALSIYDVQDLPFGGEQGLKYKKLYFWERDYQTMIERKIPWSTSRLVQNAANLPDKDRAVFTGDALRDLIVTALGENQTFDAEWDRGSSKINYTSPANNSSYDDFVYLYKSHVCTSRSGTNGDFAIISRNRFNREWKLESMTDVFSKAVINGKPGPYQMEHFFISDSTPQTGDNVPSISPYKTPINRGVVSLENNMHLGQYSSIQSYQFVDMAAIDNVKAFNSIPVYSNDLAIGQFNMEFESHDIKNVKDYIQTNYVNKLKHTIRPEVLLTLNKLKTEGRIVDPNYALGLTSTERLANGQNLLLSSSIFLNQCVAFTVKGSTHRTSNMFIGIDRLYGETSNDFDNRLLGQWYVINCKHMFVEDTYINELVCVKIHSCDVRDIKDDI